MAKKNDSPAGTLAHRFDLFGMVEGLLGDLAQLRAGKITVQDARARADLGKQALRGVHLIVQAQRLMEGKVEPGNARVAGALT